MRLSVLGLSMFAFVALSGCLGPQKINKWVAKHYQEEPVDPPKHANAQIAVTSKLPEMGMPSSETEKNTSHVLPLLFYWQYDYKNTCTLNPQLALNNFTATVNSYSGHGLKQKLNGSRLELTVEQMPHVFVVDDKGHIIWIIYAFGWDYLSVQPASNDLVVSYRVLDNNNAELHKGSIAIADINKGFGLKMYQSLRKKTLEYLDQYDADVTTMSRRFVDKLVTEL